MRKSPRFLSPLLLQLLCGTASALDPSQPAGSYIRTAYTVENGLPSNVVESATQTRDGFLWVSTTMGLARFDGNHFISLRFSSKRWTALPSFAMAEGPDGDLWDATDNGVLRIPRTALAQSEISPIQYRLGPKPNSNNVNSLHFSRSGILWAGTAEGLFRFDRDSFVAVIPNISITRIEEAANGNLLLVTSQGFLEWQGTQFIPHPEVAARLSALPDQIFHVFDDRAGNRWYGTVKGVAREAAGRFARLQPYSLALRNAAFRISEDAEGNVWLSMSSGLYRASATGIEPVDRSSGARFAFSDRQGNLWLCTNGAGLIRFKNRTVRMFTSRDGLPNNVTMAALQTRDGRLWVGNNCGGISWLDGDRFQTLSEKDGLKNSCVTSLAEDDHGSLWIGTYGGGLFRFRDGRFQQYSKAEGLGDGAVSQVMASRDGSLWIATKNGLSHMRNEIFRTYTTADGLPRNSVVNVYEDRNGVIRVATDSGIARLVGDRFVPLPPIPDATVYWLVGEDLYGDVYAAAHPMGTFRISGDRLVSTRPNFTISMIQWQDTRGDLWFCEDSLSRTAPDGLRHWEREPNAPPDYLELGIEDGLNSRECNTGGYPGMAVTKDGQLWMATWQGLAMVDPARLPRDNRKPALYIEDIAVGKAHVAPRKGLVLEPDTHHVELYFSAIELTSPEKIHFQYRLDGVDSDWLDADANRKAIYTNFALGTHQFHVRACNSDGIWDREGIAYSITQKPHYYETSLFRFSAASSGILLMIWAYRFRLQQLAFQMNTRLDERVTERTRLARDLHDTLLQTLHASAMMVHVASEEPGNPPKTITALETASTWLSRAAVEARSSLHALRDSVADSTNLLIAFRRAGDELIAGTRLEFSVASEGTERPLHPVVRDEVFQIGREAIRNACRHSEGSRVEVTVRYGRGLTLRVRDNGKGIGWDVAVQGKAGHFGLRGMRERASRIGGKLTVAGDGESGTVIELTVPGQSIFRPAKFQCAKWFRRLFRRQKSPSFDQRIREE